MKRNIYLETVPVEEAVAAAKAALDRQTLIGVETVSTHKAAGRITAEPVYAKLSSPTYHSAAMDGIAVRAKDTFPAKEDAPLTLEKGSTYFPVNTGAPMPEHTDSVIMIENVVQVSETKVQIYAPAFPWQHVRRIGEDIVATELLITQNHKLSAYDIGALLAAGIWEVVCYKKIRLHIIPTGNEVLDFSTRPVPGKGEVVESNSQIFTALAKGWGFGAVHTPPVLDDLELLQKAVAEALGSDAQIVVIGAGSSAGSKDYTRSVMEQFGQVLVHGIKLMPGKPSLLAVADKQYGGKLMVGAPGYPVSAVICFEELIAPLACWLSRKLFTRRPFIEAELTKRTPSKLGMEEVLRLAIGKVQGRYVSTPLGRGAGMITTMTKAQGLARIPANTEGIEAGEKIQVELLVPKKALNQVLVSVGSHDNTLDILTTALMALESPVRLASTHVGSMGGLLAIKNGSCHMAGMHLFDPETKDYNFPFLQKHLPGEDITLINLAIRHQGLIVPKGNPKQIAGIEDVAERKLRFINRQRGAGTRILLDYHLEKATISPADITGYDKEEFTHMALAVNILTKTADCGLGIMAAAKALDLDFIPLAKERYDLAIPTVFLDDPKIQAMLDILQTKKLQQCIMGLGGYEVNLTGQKVYPGIGLG